MGGSAAAVGGATGLATGAVAAAAAAAGAASFWVRLTLYSPAANRLSSLGTGLPAAPICTWLGLRLGLGSESGVGVRARVEGGGVWGRGRSEG